jgi:predicted phosphoadenosine phosphosulfate sulfurtransferase
MTLHKGTIRVYKSKNVYEETLSRLRRLFDDFPNVCVGFSGGKDSTVCLNMALKVAEEKNRLPLKVIFLDQEAEYENVINYMRNVKADKRVDMYWIQAPFKINNATSFENPWLNAWEDGGEWIRDKEEDSIHENIFGAKLFYDFFPRIAKTLYPDEPMIYISGVRAEESPARTMALTHDVTYQDITWGKTLCKETKHYTFYPIYDWSYTDVWKAIESEQWEYCKIYDYLYQMGIPVKDMRVSNLHHETALKSLHTLQEIEPNNWNALCKRLDGINTTTQLGHEQYKKIQKLPFMFSDWKEYRDYLLENLITSEKYQKGFKNYFAKMDIKYGGINNIDDLYKTQIASILTNDFEYTKLKNWKANPNVGAYIKWTRGIRTSQMLKNKYINQDNLEQEIYQYEKAN